MQTTKAICCLRIILGIFLTAILIRPANAGNNAGFVFPPREKSVYDRRDVRIAVDYSCRTLSLDPNGRSVRENLEAIKSYPGLSGRQRSDVMQLEDQLHSIEDLRQRVSYLISKRNLLRSRLIGNGQAAEELAKGLQGIRENISASRETPRYPDLSSAEQKNALSVMNRLLMQERAQWSVRVRWLQEQYDWLKSIDDRGHVLAVLPSIQTFESDATLERPVAEEEGGDASKDVVSFRKELGALYVQLDRLEQRAGMNDEKVSALQGQVVDLSLQLSETLIALEEKAETVESLTQQLTDVEQRFILGQRIIREKDESMKNLEDELQELRSGADGEVVRRNDAQEEQDKSLRVMNGFLEVYRQSLEEARRTIARQDDHLKTMENQLAKLRGERARRESQGAPESRHALAADRDWGLFQQKLDELEGILEIYKGKLSDEARATREKTASINALEERLTLLENRLAKKDEALVRTRSDLRGLEKQLTAMREDLLHLRKDADGNGVQGVGVEAQVEELQTKFRDINDFLLENLRDSDRIKTHLVDQ